MLKTHPLALYIQFPQYGFRIVNKEAEVGSTNVILLQFTKRTFYKGFEDCYT